MIGDLSVKALKYSGEAAASEVETKAVQQFVLEQQPLLVVWWHQFGYYVDEQRTVANFDLIKRFSELTGLPITDVGCGSTPCVGNATVFINSNIEGASSFVVELPRDVSSRALDEQAQAFLAVAEMATQNILPSNKMEDMRPSPVCGRLRVPVDPNAIATWANAVTVGRILVSPLMFVVIPDYPGGSWVALVLWFVLCSSDGIDGYLARRHGATRSGAFLDPLADKVLVLGAMFTLVSRDVYWALPVLIIAAREVAISMYRVLVGAKGISVPASQLAKWKTLFQQLSVGFAIIPLTADKATWIWLWLLWIAVAFTTVSGLQYLWRAQKLRKTTPNLMA